MQNGVFNRPPESDKSPVLFVSLYMLLLAFFILLTSISHREQKRTDQAMGSLLQTFRSISSGADLRDSGARSAIIPDETQIRLIGVFQSELPLARYQVEGSGSTLRFTLPVDKVFEAENAIVLKNVSPVLGAIAEAMNDGSPTERREVEFLVSSGSIAVGGAAHRLALARAASMARALEGRGVPKSAMRVGVVPDEPGTVAFGFVVRAGNNGRGNGDPANGVGEGVR